MVGDGQLAQDLVQEALTKTYAAWPRLRDPRNAEAYCRKAITTTAISGSGARAGTTSADRAPARGHPWRRRPGASVSERDAVWRACWHCRRGSGRRSVLRFYEDLTEAQTAETMGCAVGTVKSQVSAGLAKLRTCSATTSSCSPPTTCTTGRR